MGRLATSAAVANREPFLQILDPSGTVHVQFPFGGSIPTANRRRVIWCQFGQQSQTNTNAITIGGVAENDTILSIPKLILEPGFQIGFQTVALDVGDVWEIGSVYVEQFPIPEGVS